MTKYKSNAICISIALFLTIFVLPSHTQTWNEVLKVTASDKARGDGFGYSVSISGQYAIVGAIEVGDANNTDALDTTGSAYIFKLDSTGSWNQIQKIVATDGNAKDYFGHSVSISGNHAIVGSSGDDGNRGAAYIFKIDTTGKWNQMKKIVASDGTKQSFFGTSVSISNRYVLVGALSNKGSAYFFERNFQDKWNQVQKVVPTSPISSTIGFGRSVSLSGQYAVIGADGEGPTGSYAVGAAYIFKRNGQWDQVQRIVASDKAKFAYFGHSVSISDKSIIVGAPKSNKKGSAYLFERNPQNKWVQKQKIIASDKNTEFGGAVSLSGERAIVGTRYYTSGFKNAYLFERDTKGKWNQTQKLVTSDFSYAVAISGDHAIVGSFAGANVRYAEGSAYFLKYGITPTNIYTKKNNGGASWKNNITIYPNPTKGNLTLELTNYQNEATVTLKSITGKTIHSQTYTDVKRIQTNITGPKGIYIIEVQNKMGKQGVYKVIKK